MNARLPSSRTRLPRRRFPWAALLVFFVGSVWLHVSALGVAYLLNTRFPQWFAPPPAAAARIELVSLPSDAAIADDEPLPEEEIPEEEPERPKEEPDGQLVEIAPPEDQTPPEDAQYLAEFNSRVPEETRAEQFKINPEVLAKQYSEEEKVQVTGEQVEDLNIDKPATGATVGNDRFDPDRDGALAALPSPFTVTNKDGADAPVPSAAIQSLLQGAPQNDLLREKKGAETALNAKEYQYASYIMRIRRLVNFYWNQNLQNLPPSVRLVKPQYTTDVNAVLDGNGALELVEVAETSGSPELDDCVVRAFHLAGPFPNPPAGLIEKDGRVYLPDMSFTVMLQAATMRYQGIDPRAGVQFPGILKSPR